MRTPRRLDAVRSRSIAHERSPVRTSNCYIPSRFLQAIYRLNISCLRRFCISVGFWASKTCQLDRVGGERLETRGHREAFRRMQPSWTF